MSNRRQITVDGNEAAASVAYRLSEAIAIFPITPSSPMAEFCDEWANRNQKNLWGVIPEMAEMQSEAGAAGAVHGALQAGSLATTFTASQGLLLMIPNMYKIAGELITLHHARHRSNVGHPRPLDLWRPLRCHGLPADRLRDALLQIRCRRRTIWRRLPTLPHWNRVCPSCTSSTASGPRTSSAKIEELSDDDLRSFISKRLSTPTAQRALTPDRPVLRGTAQNPDVFFQAREAANTLLRRLSRALSSG